MAINLQPEEKNIWRIVNAIIQLIQGRSNATGTVTLRANQTTTVVSAQNCSPDSRPQLYPMTVNAASIMTCIKAADVLLGSFTVTHASSSNTDLTFSWTCFGG